MTNNPAASPGYNRIGDRKPTPPPVSEQAAPEIGETMTPEAFPDEINQVIDKVWATVPGAILQGRRIESPFAADGSLIGEWPKAGDYYHYPQVGWCGVTPDGRAVGLSNHEVAEHDDGTITVSPSILVDDGAQRGAWHGYLERGVWRTV